MNQKLRMTLVLSFIILLLPGMLVVAPHASAAAFAGGSGTMGDPYLIANANHLWNVRDYPSAYFLQTADINLDELTGISLWEPIGPVTSPFKGKYDGGGYTIFNLTTNASSGGLFDTIGSGGSVKNLWLENVNVHSPSFAGALAADNNGIVENCHVRDGSVTCTGNVAGGLVGRHTGLMKLCSADVEVSGINYVGGLVGTLGKSVGEAEIESSFALGEVRAEANYAGGLTGNTSADTQVTSCFARGDVFGRENIGGLVGSASGAISECFAMGAATGTKYVGGLAGYIGSPDDVIHCYSVGPVSGDADTGGFAGKIGSVQIKSCYYNSETSGQSDTGKGFSRTTSQMYFSPSPAIYQGWSDTYWKFDVENQYPLLNGLWATIQATIKPPLVVLSGARWSVDGGKTWLDNNTVHAVAPGYNTVTFKAVLDWNILTPEVSVYVEPGEAKAVAGNYTRQPVISIEVNPSQGGSVAGAGPYNQGDTVTLTATANPGFDFLNWSEGGAVVSTDPVYSFTAQSSRSLVANFASSNVRRIAGVDRYATAIEISKEGWHSGSDTVVLARGDNYADALAGVPLAYRLDAPILLTRTSSLTASTRAEIIRLNPSKVIILGGTGAVSDAVATELRGMNLTVERIAGSSRYDTAALIAEEMGGMHFFDTVFIAVGTNFADALSASAYAASEGWPILLTTTDAIPNATSRAISNMGISQCYVIGGTSVISDAVLNKLPGARRISGSDRYGTAIALAQEFWPSPCQHACIATGVDFPDAVAGGVLAAKFNSGVLLVRGNQSAPNQAVQDFLIAKNLHAADIFGGASAVSDDILYWLTANLR